MQVVVVVLHLGVGPADELAPGQPVADPGGGPVGEVGGRVDGDAVVIEGLDVVIVVGDEDLQLRIVVDVADADVEAVAAVAAVARAVAVGVVAGAGQVVVPRPGRRVAARRLVGGAVRG